VSIPRLFAMMIAFSLLFAPLAMNRVMAAAPASSHSQMTEDGHCQPADEGKTDKAMAKPCCVAMCATAAVIAEASLGEPITDRLPSFAALASVHRGMLREIATPPPRLA